MMTWEKEGHDFGEKEAYSVNEIQMISMKEKLQVLLKPERYEHSIGCAYTAAALAMRYNSDMEKAFVAGLLHDCARCLSDEGLLIHCLSYDIPISDLEQEAPHLLHPKVGVQIARQSYYIEDDEILDAISTHMAGKPNMTLLQKIIFIADYIEPNRKTRSDLEHARKLAFRDLDECLYVILRDSVLYHRNKGDVFDEITEEARDYYQQQLEQRHARSDGYDQQDQQD
jgi:predicted HD superfamily hydrolase involved in NAD metabolism